MKKSKEKEQSEASRFSGELNNMNLQWFSDAVEGVDWSDEIEYVTLGPDEEAPKEEEEGSDTEVISLTPDEYENLKSSGNSAEAIKSGLESLSERLERQGKSTDNIPEQQPGESEEDFAKRIEEGLLKDGESYKVIGQAIDRKVAPYLQELAKNNLEMKKEVLRLKPETGKYFTKFEKEIDAKVQGLSPGQRMSPNAYDWAYNEVLKEHQSEIVEEQATTKAEELAFKKLEEMGFTVKDGQVFQKGSSKPIYAEGSKPGGKRKKKVYVSPEDQRKMKDLQISPEDYFL